MLHEKAIYIVEGQLFQVEKFDFDNRKAFVTQVECDYYTSAITYTKVTILETFAGEGTPAVPPASAASMAALAAGAESDPRADVETPGWPPTGAEVRSSEFEGRSSAPQAPAHGEVHVVSRVVGFKKIKFYTNENVGSGELDLPEQQMHTTSYWLKIPAATMAALPFASDDRRDGVMGLAHAMHNIAPLLLMSDAHDLGLSVDGLSVEGARRVGGSARGTRTTELSSEPTIFLYDNYPGGIGFNEPLFAMHEQLIARTRELIDECPCESGCPSCVGPEGANGPLAKAVASRLLQLLTTARAAA